MMYDLNQYRTRELPPDLVGQLIGYYHLLLAHNAFGDDRFFDPFRHGRERQHFLIAERGLVISHADVSPQVITHQGESYRVGGVGEVMTCPTFHHEGHGTRVVTAATDFILHSDSDLGMLFTGTDTAPFYEQNGWIGLPDLRLTYGEPAQPKFSDEFVMILPVTEHAKNHRADFEHGSIFVGASLW